MPNLLKKKANSKLDQVIPETAAKKKKSHYFITIILTDKYLQSSLVSNNGQGVQIAEFSPIKSYFDQRDLLEQLDISLQELGPESEDVSETVFAFDDSWLKNGDLEDSKKVILKEVTESLSLEAIGQFSTSEALAEARIIADENDSCLLLFFKDESFDLIFLKHGRLLNLISIGRSNDVVADLQEALARINKSLDDDNRYFPNKLLLTSISLNQKELNKVSNSLHKFDWTSNPGFLQEPSIAVLEEDYMIKSISLSAGKILNKEGLKLKVENKTEVPTTVTNVTPKEELPTEPELIVPDAKDNPLEAMEKKEEQASSFGIAVDEDLIKNKFPGSKKKKKDKMTELAIDQDQPKKNKKRSTFQRFFLQHKKIILIGAGAGLLSLIILFSVFSLFLSKVRVKITPDQKILQKTTQVTLNPDIAESDFEKSILKASIESKSISGQDVMQTTGISLVGEKAKGKVNIFNKTDEEEEFDAGTQLSYEGIVFTIDEDVKVASASETSSGSGTEYGKAEVAVTASDIGADANLAEETKLRVSDYYDDAFSAVVLETFSGGSSREIRVVAQADRTSLLNTLTTKLIEEAQKELDQDSKDGVYYLATGNSTVANSNFSGEVGTETESLSLDLNLNVESIKYLSTDMKQLAAEVLKQDLPENYQFVDEEPELMTAPAESASASANIKLDAELMTKAVAQLDLDALENEILGKELSEASSVLTAKETIKDAQIVFNPPFIAGVLKKLPNNANRIKFEIVD